MLEQEDLAVLLEVFLSLAFHKPSEVVNIVFDLVELLYELLEGSTVDIAQLADQN